MRADLKVGSQCAEACIKANKLLGLIKMTFVVRSTETMINLYKTMVRPHETRNVLQNLLRRPLKAR